MSGGQDFKLGSRSGKREKSELRKIGKEDKRERRKLQVGARKHCDRVGF